MRTVHRVHFELDCLRAMQSEETLPSCVEVGNAAFELVFSQC